MIVDPESHLSLYRLQQRERARYRSHMAAIRLARKTNSVSSAGSATPSPRGASPPMPSGAVVPTFGALG